MPKDTSHSWTLEKELCKVAGESDLARALHALGLLSDPSASFCFGEQDDDWKRGGAETYLFGFQVLEAGSQPSDVLIKACVAYSPGGSIEKLLAGWIERRELLANNGVSAPRLYGWGHGVIIEEFIPFQLQPLLTGPIGTQLIEGVLEYAASLSDLGFAAIDPFADLRSRGTDVVAVDFGEDLGPPRVVSRPQPELFARALDYIRSGGVDVSPDRANALWTIFATRNNKQAPN